MLLLSCDLCNLLLPARCNFSFQKNVYTCKCIDDDIYFHSLTKIINEILFSFQ